MFLFWVFFFVVFPPFSQNETEDMVHVVATQMMIVERFREKVFLSQMKKANSRAPFQPKNQPSCIFPLS